MCENGTFLFLLPLSDTFSFLTAFGNHPNCLMEIFALPKMLKITPEDSNFFGKINVARFALNSDFWH